jgi:hypothetical protein
MKHQSHIHTSSNERTTAIPTINLHSDDDDTKILAYTSGINSGPLEGACMFSTLEARGNLLLGKALHNQAFSSLSFSFFFQPWGSVFRCHCGFCYYSSDDLIFSHWHLRVVNNDFCVLPFWVCHCYG